MSEAGEPGELAEGTLISHLLELRDRLLKAMLAVGICFIPCAIYMNQLFTFIAKPLIARLPSGATMIATSVVGTFTVPFKLAMVAALGLAMPYVLYQAWAFVAPGLYRHERKFAVPLLVSSVLLFYAGGRFDDDRHVELSRLRHGAAARIRRRVRSAGGHGPSGLDRAGQIQIA